MEKLDLQLQRGSRTTYHKDNKRQTEPRQGKNLSIERTKHSLIWIEKTEGFISRKVIFIFSAHLVRDMWCNAHTKKYEKKSFCCILHSRRVLRSRAPLSMSLRLLRNCTLWRCLVNVKTNLADLKSTWTCKICVVFPLWGQGLQQLLLSTVLQLRSSQHSSSSSASKWQKGKKRRKGQKMLETVLIRNDSSVQ